MDTCYVCDEHRTMLGSLVSCFKGIMDSPDLRELTIDEKIILTKTMFEQSCLDERTRMIQGFKKSNITQIKK